jgi:CRISPR-associated protein Cas1
MYAIRFKEEPPERRSVEQLRGIEGVRVRKMYELLARQYGVTWASRNYVSYEMGKWRCSPSLSEFSHGVSLRHLRGGDSGGGLCSAVGFIHTGKPQSFVYDIADVFKFETVVPVAFRIAAKKPKSRT